MDDANAPVLTQLPVLMVGSSLQTAVLDGTVVAAEREGKGNLTITMKRFHAACGQGTGLPRVNIWHYYLVAADL